MSGLFVKIWAGGKDGLQWILTGKAVSFFGVGFRCYDFSNTAYFLALRWRLNHQILGGKLWAVFVYASNMDRVRRE